MNQITTPLRTYLRLLSECNSAPQLWLPSALRACLEIAFWVAQATGLCRPATRRTEWGAHRQRIRAAFCWAQPCSLRSARRRPERAGRPSHPFFKHALRWRGREFLHTSQISQIVRVGCRFPPPLSHPLCANRRTMKTRVNGLNEACHLLLIARFGAARLFERPDGRAELRGGAEPERTEAKEWISLFAHELRLSFS